MKRLLTYVWLAVFFCSVHAVYARKVYSVEEVPNVQLSDAGNFVSDPERILSPAVIARINTILSNLRDSTSIEVAVVVVPSIGNDTPEDFTVRLFERWGIGKKGEDNGLLILLATEDRIVRFEVGYGLEGVMTDAISKRIQTQRMNGYLARGDWDTGMLEGVKAVNEYLTDPDSGLAAAADTETDGDAGFIGNIVLIMVCMGVIVLISFLASRRKKRCPRCNTKMEVVEQQTNKLSENVRLITTTYQCPNCGYTMKKNHTENMGGGIAGGMGGGWIVGRGGFGGGSWGGGRSGGGGATSRF